MSKVHIEGSGAGRDVVLLHGTPMAPTHLERLARELAATHRTWVVHLPGYGEAAALPAGHSVEDIEECVQRGLAENGVGSAAVIGVSGGAYHALGLALGRGVRVTQIVALSGFSCLAPEQRAAFSGLATALRSGLDLATVLVPSVLAPAFAEAHPDAAREVSGWARAKDAWLLADELEAFAASPDLTAGTSSLDIPILARVGELDVSTPVALSETIVRAARRGRLEVVPGVGHALLLEDLKGTVEAVRRALG